VNARGTDSVTTSDGIVIGTTKVVDHGPPALRWNLLILGDGYTRRQLPKYHVDVDNFVSHFNATVPFDQMWDAINIYRVDIASTDSGADDPTPCGGSGKTARTYLDASFCHNGIRRLLTVNSGTALSVAIAQVPEMHSTMVIVNSSVYGGSGGAVAVLSSVPSARETALHELGHSAFGLADEYEYYAGCGSGESGHDNYVGGEPAQPNITIDTNLATNKWHNLISPAAPMPTTRNADCTRCDWQPSPVPIGTVGVFEGAYYHHCGVYRPDFNCRMRALGYAFCAVCQQAIRQTLAPFVP
jgi:hypothetical protein